MSSVIWFTGNRFFWGTPAKHGSGWGRLSYLTYKHAIRLPLMKNRKVMPDGIDSWVSIPHPLFDESSTPALRIFALAGAPLAFRRRNIFTPSVDLPLALRPGRPTKSAEEKRKTNAERQRRFRAVRRDELAALRKIARKNIKQSTREDTLMTSPGRRVGESTCLGRLGR